MPKTIILLETVAKEAMQLLKEASDMNIITGFDEASLHKNIAVARVKYGRNY
jgi:D-3-phosphoglycerate dehydrogenase